MPDVERKDVVAEAVKHMLIDLGLEYNPENRLRALETLKHSWGQNLEDSDFDSKMDRIMYGAVISSMIFGLQLRIKFPNVPIWDNY